MFSTALIRAGWPRGLRWPGFWLKVAGAVVIVALADMSLEVPGDQMFGGGTIGLFGMASLAIVLVSRPVILRDRRALAAVLVAVLLCASLLNDPGFFTFVGFWAAMAMAVLLTRADRFGDAWLWTMRLVQAGVQALGWLPLRDLSLLLHPRLRRRLPSLRMGLLGLFMPVAGSLVFVLLFASANPVIARFVPTIDLDRVLGWVSPLRMFFRGVVFCAIWGLLRPRLRIRAPRGVLHLQLLELGRAFLFAPRSLLASLVSFNLIFAVQNALDLAFLSGGARLPDDMTLAEYAHRSAYPLIATVLLAAVFVLVALRPGISRLIRALVCLWVAQNVVLVGFSVLRTLNYVWSYDLTVLRLQALIWMVLVAFGLVTIVVRILQDRSAAWLINVNAAAAGLVLLVASFIDLPRIVADYNVREAREITGTGQRLHYDHLMALGHSALPAMFWFAAQPHFKVEIPLGCSCQMMPPKLCAVAENKRQELAERQANWRSWSFQGARILATLDRDYPQGCAVPAVTDVP